MIRHVLFDADGVVQGMPVPWLEAMEPYVGDRAREFLHETWAEELPMLRGEGDYLRAPLPLTAATLAKFGVGPSVEEVYAAVWLNLEVAAESVGLIHALRTAGYGVHLGTNQENDRAAYMRTSLGYDELFDVSCYSCELGAAKPDTAFFERATDLIGAHPSEVLFIDDTPRNVDAARGAGLAAELWHLDDGHEQLRTLLPGGGTRRAADLRVNDLSP